MVVQTANHIPGFARQQPGLEANKGDRAGRIYHRPGGGPGLRIESRGDIQRHNRRRMRIRSLD